MVPEEEDDELEEESTDDVAHAPSDIADPEDLVKKKLPKDILSKYEIYSYRNAALILSETRKAEFGDIVETLREFSITKQMIRVAGGNESAMPKLFSGLLRPRGWYETTVQGDLVVSLKWKEQAGTTKSGKPRFEKRERSFRRARYLDGHKIDYVKNKVAFDLEWNSKDQTFDRDLYAFSAFAQCGVIDAGVIVTRSERLNPVLRELGPALDKNGNEEKKKNGKIKMTHEKYGASTTWMGKLLYRLNAGRNGSCPILVVGITPSCISDWKKR